MAFCTWRGDEYYRDHFEIGVYVCSACGYEMFSSLAKYEHHTPWPAFKKPIHLDSLRKIPEEGRPNALKMWLERLSRWSTVVCHASLECGRESYSNNPQPTFGKKVSCGRCGNGLGHEFLKDRDDGGSRF